MPVGRTGQSTRATNARVRRQDHCAVIALGCTGMLGAAAQLRYRLAAKGLRVPVIDPAGAAVSWLPRPL